MAVRRDLTASRLNIDERNLALNFLKDRDLITTAIVGDRNVKSKVAPRKDRSCGRDSERTPVSRVMSRKVLKLSKGSENFCAFRERLDNHFAVQKQCGVTGLVARTFKMGFGSGTGGLISKFP